MMRSIGAKPARLSRSSAMHVRRTREEAARGNQNALRHGVWADVLRQPDVAAEVELTFALHPSLDRLLDARLVQHYAVTSARLQALHLAIDRDGFTAILTSFEARMGPLLERLERTVQERAAQREREAAALAGTVDLLRYRPKGAAS